MNTLDHHSKDVLLLHGFFLNMGNDSFEIQTRAYVTALRGLLVWVARKFAFVPGDCWKFWESWYNNMLGSLLTTTMNRAILNGTVFFV